MKIKFSKSKFNNRFVWRISITVFVSVCKSVCLSAILSLLKLFYFNIFSICLSPFSLQLQKNSFFFKYKIDTTAKIVHRFSSSKKKKITFFRLRNHTLDFFFLLQSSSPVTTSQNTHVGKETVRKWRQKWSLWETDKEKQKAK